MFKVEVIGNLGADAEIKDANGSKFVTMRVAHTDKWTQQDGREKEITTWIDVTMNNTESKVIPYLKQGVKVFVRGNASLRVYSSPKDRMMKAGLQVSALEIELCGGSVEAVPRQLIVPDTGQLVDTQKFYWCNAETKGMKKDDTRQLIDRHGNAYLMNNQGFVAPVLPDPAEQADQSQGENESESQK